MPSFLQYQHHLRILCLSKCNIGGNFPNWLLENNPRLGEVYLDGNAFSGSLEFPFLPNLKAFDISSNKIQGQLPPNIGSIYPKLMIFKMSNNMLEGLLPSSFGDMKDLQCLDLSGNKLTGDLPIGLARKGSKLNFLRLSNNMLKGEIFPVLTNINNFAYLFLDGNNFSGPIPQALSTASLISLDLSYNNLSGNLPVCLGNITSLASLALSGNHLRGHIPPDYCRLERLEVLDLSENNLVGAIPSCFSDLQDLRRVYLSKNMLQGEFNMFSNSHLQMLDLGDNNFNGSIPKWLDKTSEITALLLKGNRLQGTIPPQLCHASYLRILDLSHNNISGPIPHCLGNIMQNPWDTDVYDSPSFGYGDFEMFGGNTLIDVDDSFETTSTISFPNSFGALIAVEFTTKYNTYSYEGSILSYMFGVDLTGMTPQRTAQFATFDESSYEVNPFLCGPPLHISCTEAKEIPTYLPALNFSEDDASFLAMEWFCISFLVAYANVVVVVLCVNPSWRNVWFYYIESFMYSCYDYFASKSS